MSLSVMLEDIGQEVNTADAMKATNYIKPDLCNEANKSIDLSDEKNEHLFQILKKHNNLFQGQHGNWIGEPVTLQIKPDAKQCAQNHTPYYSRIEMSPLVKWTDNVKLEPCTCSYPNKPHNVNGESCFWCTQEE